MNFIDRFNVYFYHLKREKLWPQDSARIQGWRNTNSQEIRFAIFEQNIDFCSKSVLDLGCGYGDFYHYLQQTASIGKYTGIDFHKNFVKQARKKAGENSHFVHGNFAELMLEMHDIVIASGSLNYRSDDPNYLASMIELGYRKSRKTFGFNLLDRNYCKPDGLLQSYFPEDVVRLCHHWCEEVVLIDNYLDYDFTIIMQKT
ncbi:class I SAM-dependent methyltransferase [Vibrio caribbeanicus]|uniref:Putative cyclopropane fatty acid synthase n=1 Tax=Vibrio caribbeanicus ATCC BAA-2122 TaxID=796620 RepID=E3BHH3_9VIBR|nr:class I SAM-dependent methyltransferase [Vibrio caribbeanicus]EFP97504.1 putative cyclopropane fatty acid synthase [Vibrio caribbeanicus ATCC BAA-2122]